MSHDHWHGGVQVSCFQDSSIQPFIDHSPDDTIRHSLVKDFT